MENIIKEICQKEGLACREVQPLTGGQVNAVYRVDGQYVLRIGSREGAAGRLARETVLLRSLAGELPVPKIYAFGQHNGRTYQIQQYLPGQKLYTLWKHLGPDEQDALAAELAGCLKILHGRSLPSFGDPEDNGQPGKSWQEFMAAQFERTLDDIRALGLRMAPGFLELAAEYFAAHQEALQDGVPVLVHGDLSPLNILIDGGKITALLDFEYAWGAPRDYELWTPEAFCLYPNDWAEEDVALDHQASTEHQAGTDQPHKSFCTADFAGFFPLLRKHYPEVFATPRLRERTNLYHLEAALSSYLAWRKDNLGSIPPEKMAAKEFYMARITNFVFRNGVRLFL